MLRGSFYQELSVVQQEDGLLNSVLRINRDHDIFKGHFPGLPIVPGVCMMQIIKEQLEHALNRSLSLSSAANIKFLGLINPLENKEIGIHIRYNRVADGTVNAEGSILAGEVPFFKIIKAVYR